MSKFIFVSGGVISGLGKGVITSSIGNLLKSKGFKVTSCKIDPYINIDAGTMRPTEHGEVFVTFDGGETDQDLGTYERFLDINLSKIHSITTGQVYLAVINMERNLEYEGKCVEVIPHIPHEVRRRIHQIAEEDKADFVMIEVGGTVGDYQNVLFLEAGREMKLAGEEVLFIHVVYLPVPSNLGEMKSKPAQHSVKELNSIGIQPDFIFTRSEKPIDDVRKEKLSLFCNLPHSHIISSHDVSSIYEVPLVLESQNICEKILKRFNLKNTETEKYREWKAFVNKIKNLKKEVRIGIVGKYFDIGNFSLEDSYVSVIEAIKHACYFNNAKPKIEWIDSKVFEKNREKLKELRNYAGVIVPGGFGSSGVEGKILAIEYLRKNKIPFLGLCYGLQLAVVEYARNVCGMKDAHTTEINPNTKYPVIDIMPEQKKNIQLKHYGATMRLGNYPAQLKKGTLAHKLYGQEIAVERHRHRYEVNPHYISVIEKYKGIFSGFSPDRRLMEYFEINNHPFFLSTQAHPEFTSRPLKPNPMFNGFIRACLLK